MKAWRRTYRKQYGKTANPEDFLLDNATRIRKALTQFEAAYADWVKYMNETHSSVDIAELVETHYQRIDNMWPLDVEDTEAREIERMSQRLQSVEELQEKQAKAARRAERRKQFN